MRMPRKSKKAFRKFDRQLGLRERRRITRVSRWLTQHSQNRIALPGTWAYWIPVKKRANVQAWAVRMKP